MYSTDLKREIKNKLFFKSGIINKYIYTEKFWIKNNLVELRTNIYEKTSFIPYDARLDERLFVIINDVDILPLCPVCEKMVKFKRYGLGYSTYCSVKCRANHSEWQMVVRDTNKKRYGVEFIAQLPHERIKRGIEFRYNVKHTFDYSNAQKKRRKTLVRIYGEDYNSGWTEEAIKKRINNGNMVPYELRDEYLEYKRQVELITRKQPINTLENHELRGVIGKDENPYHLDHVISMYEGFMEDVPPEIIGNIINLRFIPAGKNITKGNKSNGSLQDLIERYEKRIR